MQVHLKLDLSTLRKGLGERAAALEPYRAAGVDKLQILMKAAFCQVSWRLLPMQYFHGDAPSKIPWDMHNTGWAPLSEESNIILNQHLIQWPGLCTAL